MLLRRSVGAGLGATVFWLRFEHDEPALATAVLQYCFAIQAQPARWSELPRCDDPLAMNTQRRTMWC